MPRKLTTVGDVDQRQLVKSVAAFLKKSGKVVLPEWVDVVKTGAHTELAPMDPDWFYVRTASIARRLYWRNPAGIGGFRKVYGHNKRRGVMPNRFNRSGGSAIRKPLQALETINWVEKSVEGGRRLTAQGRRDLNRIAAQIRFNKTA